MSDTSDQRWLWINEAAHGSFSIGKLNRMARAGEINHATLFWSERRNQWEPLVGLLNDLGRRSIDDLVAIGIQFVEVLGSRTSEDCAVCSELQDMVIPIEEAPSLPPAGCTCIPWCRCLILSVRRQKAKRGPI